MVQADLLQALRTPFALAGELLLLISVLVYIWAKLRSQAEGVQAARMALVAIAFSFIVTAMVAYQSVRQIENDREYRSLHAVYTVRASIKGTIRITTASEPQNFRVSSGQINVGCNDGQRTTAAWSVPQDATDIQATASWENTNNAKDLAQTIVNLAPPVVTATGYISGLDRNFFGNCPGGGHGELVLKGTYRLARNEAHPQQTLKTLDDKVNRTQPFVIAVPHGPDMTPESCDLSIEDGTRRETIHLDLQVGTGNFLVIRNRTISSSPGKEIPVDITLDQDRITLRIL